MCDKYAAPLLIHNWEELAALPDSETHSIKVEHNCCGWMISKEPKGLDNLNYLSTHTFYESTYENSTKRLQECGFNVQLKSWG
jgi:hypothetical protein